MLDVIVAGGGPAGAVAALVLARAGLDVAVVERAQFPRRKVCGEYINAGAVAQLDRLGLGGVVRALASPLRGVRLVAPSSASVELPFSSDALACARETLDAALIGAAVGAGARLLHARVEDVVFEGSRATGIRMRIHDGSQVEVRARWIVGADGCGSIVARRAGLTRPSRGMPKFAVGGHYDGFADLGGFVEMYVGSGAYFALNPLGAGRTNVMVVVPKPALERWSSAIDEGIAGAAAQLGRGHRSFAEVRRSGQRVAVGPLAHDVTGPIGEGLILAGDAAGFLNPFTGQGIFLALQSGERAALAILAAARAAGDERQAFGRYARERGRDVSDRKRLSRAVGYIIDIAPLARRAVARLQRAPALGSALIDALAGIRAPSTALTPAVLGKLLF